MQIRLPRTADADQLAALNRELGYAVEPQEMRLRIERLSGLREHYIAVAEVEGDVVGWVHAEQRFSMESGAKAELVGLVVGAGRRRHGIGRSLVRAAEEWAADRGLDAIVVRSNVVRPESHDFYKRIGYAPAKTQHVYVRPLRPGTEA